MEVCTIGPFASEPGRLQEFSDAELVQEVTRRAGRERHATADLLRALIEFDERRLYLAEGFPSLFAYCTDALHYSEHAAFNRIEVARAAARWPQLLTALEDGSLHLAGARLLAPHLTAENIDSALESARHKSKRDIEEIAARLAQRTLLVAVDAEQYRLYLTISRAARDTLRQVQALMAHQVPDANAAVIFEQALTVLLQKLERQRFAATDRPSAAGDGQPVISSPQPAAAEGNGAGDTPGRSAGSRHIPAAVRRAVWKRDGARCAFVGEQGRCSERSRLEFHHLIPFAAGGTATTSNIELRCRAHNAFEAEMYFGAETVAAARERRRSPAGPSGRSTDRKAPSVLSGADADDGGE